MTFAQRKAFAIQRFSHSANLSSDAQALAMSSCPCNSKQRIFESFFDRALNLYFAKIDEGGGAKTWRSNIY
jgi:hypothetical protein